MKEKLKEVLKDNYILWIDDCLMFLLAIERGLKPIHFNNYVAKVCCKAGLVVWEDASESFMYRGENSSPQYGGFQWVVDEYLQLFKNAGTPKRDLHEKITVGKMEKFFSKNPSVRKDEVIMATRLYIIDKVGEGSFLREPRYFILKNRESDLLSYIDYIADEKKKFENKDYDSTPVNRRIS